MDTTPSFREYQKALATYALTGEGNVDSCSLPNNLQHYRRLVFNVTFDILSNAFPIARKQLGAQWKAIIEEFQFNHKCISNQVWRMPEEFFVHVLNYRSDLLLDLPYLNDLLRFEWIEIELYSEQDKDLIVANSQLYQLNPHSRIVQFDFPVYKPIKEWDAEPKGNYYLAIYRDLEELKVRFIELSELVFLVLEPNQISQPFDIHFELSEVATKRFGLTKSKKMSDNIQALIDSLIKSGLVFPA
jgi:hypothetical protein